MTKVFKEIEEARQWLATKHVPDISARISISPSKLYYFLDGKAQSPSYQLVRELQLLKEKEAR